MGKEFEEGLKELLAKLRGTRMEKDFEEALMELLDEYHETPLQDRISALELRLMALKEEAAE